jgi:hypothetical protein
VSKLRRPIPFDEFVQRVRRHRVSDVLEAVAFASVALDKHEYQDGPPPPVGSVVQQWSLAGVARASIVAGNEFRTAPVSWKDLEEMCLSFVNAEDPILVSGPGEERLSSFLIRLAFEQFPLQLSIFEELARTEALLGQAAAECGQRVISGEFWNLALGCSLRQFVRLGLLLNIGALQNSGYYDPRWLDQHNFAPILDILPRPVVENVAARHFLGSPNDFKEVAAAHRQADRYLRKHEFNPLVVSPFVEQPDGRYIAPVPRFALTRATPTGLYYIGLEQRGEEFTTALGKVFEHYVGNQLGLLQPRAMLHDIEYARGQNAADWIVVMPSFVLIVEVKVTPLSADARVGGGRLRSDLDRALGKAIRQIERTVDLIRQEHSAFQEIPLNRPIVGLVTTLEPYFQCHSELVWRRDTPSIPILLASSRELEQLVSISTADEILLKAANDGDRAQWSLGNALVGEANPLNPILAAAWETYSFESAGLSAVA